MQISDSCICGSKFTVSNEVGENTYETKEVYTTWMEFHKKCNGEILTGSKVEIQIPDPKEDEEVPF